MVDQIKYEWHDQIKLECAARDRLKAVHVDQSSHRICFTCDTACGLQWWWLVHKMTASNGNIFRVTGPLWGNSPVTGEFPVQRPGMRSFDAVFDLHLNKGWVNNREAGDLRRHRAHYDVIVMIKHDVIPGMQLVVSCIPG